MIKSLAHVFHELLAALPWLARGYFAVLARVGPCLPRHRRNQVMNSLNTTSWRGISITPREIQLAGGTRLVLRPHAGEFDFEAALGGNFSYEEEVFGFLASILDRYDVVVDVGANVGVFTTFMGRRLAGKGKVFAFEPSREVFGRLLENVQRNKLENVQIFNCAIGKESGFAIFTEPEGHLTNGSLVESFARQFSDKVRRTAVTVIGAHHLAALLEDEQRVLVKIDTEGYEAVVLEALSPLLAKWKPDLVIEVLPEFEATLNGVKILSELGYQAHSITPEGLQRTGRITATHWRDCFLSVEKES